MRIEVETERKERHKKEGQAALILLAGGILVVVIGAAAGGDIGKVVAVIGLTAVLGSVIWFSAIPSDVAQKGGGRRVACPKCGSPSVVGAKEGYDAASGCCGALLAGPFGLLCGFLGADALNVHCMKCGHKWRA